MKDHLVRHDGHVTREDRNRLGRHKGGVIWFTGLPASGKSTLAYLLEKELHALKTRAYVLDGDNVRHGLNSDLGFSREDRKENIRRIAEVAKLFADAGFVVMCAFITPYEEDRDFVRGKLGNDNFLEIYVKCCLQTCEERDQKGFYAKARAGVIKNYTGISSPFEVPGKSHLVIDTEELSPGEAVTAIIRFLDENKFLEVD